MKAKSQERGFTERGKKIRVEKNSNNIQHQPCKYKMKHLKKERSVLMKITSKSKLFSGVASLHRVTTIPAFLGLEPL
jgi:hypothetical protein